MQTFTLRRSLAATVAVVALLSPLHARDYAFEGKISRPVLENYLSRSITFGELLNSEQVQNALGGDTDDNIRMLTHTGAKFIGRALYMWGSETRLPRLLELGKPVAHKLHTADPDIVIQAAAFEIVSDQLDKMSLPAWVFEAFDQPVETRNFRYKDMLYPDGHRVDHWRPGSSVPDMSRLETRMWFYYLCASYRNHWLQYAWDWIRKTDPNGFLQMPGSRTLADPVNGHNWYWANTPSDRVPTGFNQEETIKQIWDRDN